MKKIIVFAFILFAVIMVLFSSCQKELSSGNSGTGSSSSGSNATNTYYYQVGSTVMHSGKTWYSTVSDTSGVHISASGTYILSNSRVWTSGNTSSTDSSSFYGLNAGVLAYNGNITLKADSIRTTGTGANGVFAYGSGVVNMTADTVVCSGDYAHAVMTAGGGTLTATDVVAVTSGSSSSIIATDRGGGIITVSGGKYTTNGANAAAVYSTGTVNVTGATLTTNGAEAFVIEGANNATIKNCTTICNYNKWGALLYQSFSGDADGTVGILTVTGGTFTYTGTKGGLFYNTNDTAYVYLNAVGITNSCDTLVRSIKGSWNGVDATSGGNTYLICSGQALSGLVYADSYSKATVKLTNSSMFTGKVNPGNTAGYTAVTIDASSTWVLTGNTYLSSLSNANSGNSNITAGTYHLYVKGLQVL